MNEWMNEGGNWDQCTHGGVGLRQKRGQSAILEEMREHPDTDARRFVAVYRCSRMFTSKFSAMGTRSIAKSERREDAGVGRGRRR